MKKVIVTSCSHSQGRPSMRVTMSQVTVTVKPVMATPHSSISAYSTPSSTRHFRWRCSCRTRAMAPSLLHIADEAEDFDGVRSQVLGELVLDRCADLLEAGLVHPGEDLDAHLLQAGARFLFHLEGLRRLHLVHVVGRLLHPFLLLGAQARPGLVADEQH